MPGTQQINIQTPIPPTHTQTQVQNVPLWTYTLSIYFVLPGQGKLISGPLANGVDSQCKTRGFPESPNDSYLALLPNHRRQASWSTSIPLGWPTREMVEMRKPVEPLRHLLLICFPSTLAAPKTRPQTNDSIFFAFFSSSQSPKYFFVLGRVKVKLWVISIFFFSVSIRSIFLEFSHFLTVWIILCTSVTLMKE